MEKVSGLVLAFGVIALLLAGCTQSGGSATVSPGAGQGRYVATVTDAAADMGSVTSVQMTIDNVQAHSATQGWVTLSSQSRTVDLMQLKTSGNQALVADTQVAAGTYDQIRMQVSRVSVTDAQGTHEAKLPSGELKIVATTVVNANSTSIAKFDFIADQSLHITGNGRYIMAPVIKIETRSDANVNVASQNDVTVEGGSVDTNAQVGMDISGNVGAGVRIPADAVLDINANGVIVTGSSLSGEGNAIFGLTDAAMNMGSVTSVKITVDSVMVKGENSDWTTVSTATKTYDLLQLNSQDRTAILANATLKEGTYDQVRLHVSKVEVTDSEGVHEAKLPSDELKVMAKIVVKANSTSTEKFDFIANESLHKTGNGKYILAPVIHVETRDDANVTVKGDDDVEFSEGHVETDLKVGMDVKGDIDADLIIPADADISIDGGGIILVS